MSPAMRAVAPDPARTCCWLVAAEPCGRRDIAVHTDEQAICFAHLDRWLDARRAARDAASREYVTRTGRAS